MASSEVMSGQPCGCDPAAGHVCEAHAVLYAKYGIATAPRPCGFCGRDTREVLGAVVDEHRVFYCSDWHHRRATR